MKSLEMFSGGGGLALGMDRAGFRHVALVEYDHDSCETLRANSGSACLHGRKWPIYELDAREFLYSRWAGKIQVLAGGPPCQPFSIAGKHAGHSDHRNMFPEVLRATRALRPQAILIENVRGLARDTFRPYLEYITLYLRFPTITPHDDEAWEAHAERLRRVAEERAHLDLEYHVYGPHIVNLVDYGVPQNRARLFIVALRSDVRVEWVFPEPTHSRDALLYDQWVTGVYWKRHELQRPKDAAVPQERIERLRLAGPPQEKPWCTVRDALRGLPEPVDGVEHPLISNHMGIPGARSYYGHSGSSYDQPAKTLKAGGHGVPGGENMLLRDDGTVRYFTVRESARLQTFPDNYVFSGSRTETMRQIGNAVPVLVAETFARHLRSLLEAATPRPVRSAPPEAPEPLPLAEAIGWLV